MLLALALVAAACGDGDGGDTTTTAADDTPTTEGQTTTTEGETTTTAGEPMVCEATVGFMGPITGPVAFIGEVQLNWFNHALDTFNTEMSYDFQSVEGDNQFDTAQSATLAQQFLDNTSMVAAVGPAGSDQVDAAGAVFEAGDPNFTFISPSSTRSGITAQYTGMFRTVPTDDDQGPTTADFLVAQGAENVFMVDDQSSYSTGLAESVEENLTAANVTVTRESVAQDVTDFSALVGTIPDDTNFVYLPWQVAANGQIFANQMAEQGKEAVIFGSDGMDSDDFTEAGSYLAAFAPDIAGIEGSQSILEGYLEQYDDTNTFGPPVYAAARVIFEAIARVCEAGQVPDRANVQAEVRNTDQADSILGSPISFTEDGDLVEGQFFIFQIQEDGSKTLVP
ncbi:MAG TPA: branched-chain amino acid ABC transporter substrate-binding protein [Acidimicrobiia bacterium]|nr:branched-chain amino acid ABC transporter substrate-binding protein [Acidimicrobiia bacterium]